MKAQSKQKDFNKRRRVFYLNPEPDAHRPFLQGLLLSYVPYLFLESCVQSSWLFKRHKMLSVQLHSQTSCDLDQPCSYCPEGRNQKGIAQAYCSH